MNISSEPVEKKKSNVLWDFFCSVKLTLFLLVVLAATSIFGTLIPQQDGAMEFARRLSPALFRLFSSLELFDMYHSIWFRVILGALTINLILCSLNRLPYTMRRFRAKPKPDRSKPFQDLPDQRNLTTTGDLKGAADRVGEFLKTRYRNIRRKETEKGLFYYCEKGRYAHFGVYLVHLSVLLILMGGMIGSIWGFEAFMNIPEGERIDTVQFKKSNVSKKLPFQVHCETFIVDFYDSGAPKRYQSDIRFLVNGEVSKKGSLLVNHPMAFKGITFYQASYGRMPGGLAQLRISRKGSGQADFDMQIRKWNSIPLPGKEGTFQIVRLDGNLQGMMGPAALVLITPEIGEEKRFWIFQEREMLKMRFPKAMLESPMLNASAFEPYTFALNGITTRYYTGLQVNRDPGVPLVWVGFILIVVGLFVTFFTSHRRIWMRIFKDGNMTVVQVAGRANRNPVGMDRDLDHLASRLSRRLHFEG
ncbi:MAG: cytochrome c biogenesis protein ResB [Deltaproteobacteria bacterium]|nr:cytochrome c biogenesis protein ResB [Deltaproteobacteria bacterium]